MINELTPAERIQILGGIRDIILAKKLEIDSLAEQIKMGKNYDSRAAAKALRKDLTEFGAIGPLIILMKSIEDAQDTTVYLMEKMPEERERLANFNKKRGGLSFDQIMSAEYTDPKLLEIKRELTGKAPEVLASRKYMKLFQQLEDAYVQQLPEEQRNVYGTKETLARLKRLTQKSPGRLFGESLGKFYYNLILDLKHAPAQREIYPAAPLGFRPFDTVFTIYTGTALIALLGTQAYLDLVVPDDTENLAENREALLKQVERYQKIAVALVSACNTAELHQLLNRED
ncbi:MAG: hypothetical protein C5B49_15275 [Bdellovibrio sp.]|nr:MAG: hypothetical protein C5B49_15275 [Bdellovibrio sp.]